MAASMLVNMGFISADVVEYVLIDYMIENRTHWKSKYEECIEELNESINACYFDQADEYEGQDEEEWQILFNGVKDRPDYPQIFIEHSHKDRPMDRYWDGVGICIGYMLGGKNAKERMNEAIDRVMEFIDSRDDKDKLEYMTKTMNSIKKRALELL